jgi:hypothetical protein
MYSGNTNDLNSSTFTLDNTYNYMMNGEYDEWCTGYKVLLVNKNINSIVINKLINTIPPNSLIYDHYISKTCFNSVTLYKGIINEYFFNILLKYHF